MADENQQASQAQSQAQPSQQPAAQGEEAFVKHLERASSIVQSWPAWKQQVLGGTAAQQAASARR